MISPLHEAEGVHDEGLFCKYIGGGGEGGEKKMLCPLFHFKHISLSVILMYLLCTLCSNDSFSVFL